MATKAANRRLTKEYLSLQESSPPYITARPSEANILEWHYIIDGPLGTPYEDGQYHGTVVFPREYPFKPPTIKMVTPSGRFSPNGSLCLTMSSFHPELWNPAWNVATILNGLLSFMTGDDSTTGSILTDTPTKMRLAKESVRWNTLTNVAFKKVFPDIWQQNKEVIEGTRTRESQIRRTEIVKKKAVPDSDTAPEAQKLVDDVGKATQHSCPASPAKMPLKKVKPERSTSSTLATVEKKAASKPADPVYIDLDEEKIPIPAPGAAPSTSSDVIDLDDEDTLAEVEVIEL
jgi:ubiquitin-conjugating enzyme E2 J2